MNILVDLLTIIITMRKMLGIKKLYKTDNGNTVMSQNQNPQ